MILWGLIIICSLSWFWTVGYLVCEALGKDPRCKVVRRISGKVVPHIDLSKFYNNYIKNPICIGALLNIFGTNVSTKSSKIKMNLNKPYHILSLNVVDIEKGCDDLENIIIKLKEIYNY